MSPMGTPMSSIEQRLAALCPRDTDGDGNCGQYLCPWCGTAPEVRASRFWFVVGLIKEMAADIWDDTRITSHAVTVLAKRYGETPQALEEYAACLLLLGLYWGWDAEQAEEDPGYWTSPADFLDEHLHFTRGARHIDLIRDLRELARDIDPSRDERYPGFKSNDRPRRTKASA